MTTDQIGNPCTCVTISVSNYSSHAISSLFDICQRTALSNITSACLASQLLPGPTQLRLFHGLALIDNIVL